MARAAGARTKEASCPRPRRRAAGASPRAAPVRRPRVPQPSTLSLLGTGMWSVAVVWQVIDLGGGPVRRWPPARRSAPWWRSCSAACSPTRVPQRWILLGVEAIKAVLIGTTAWLSLTGRLELGVVVPSVVVGATDGFLYPAFTAMLPSILPTDHSLGRQRRRGHDAPGAHAGRRPQPWPAPRLPPAPRIRPGCGRGLAGARRRRPEPVAGGGGAPGADRRRRARPPRSGRWSPTCVRASPTWPARRGCSAATVRVRVGAADDGPDRRAAALRGARPRRWRAARRCGARGVRRRQRDRLPRRRLLAPAAADRARVLVERGQRSARPRGPDQPAVGHGGGGVRRRGDRGLGNVIWGTLLQRRVPPALLGPVRPRGFFSTCSCRCRWRWPGRWARRCGSGRCSSWPRWCRCCSASPPGYSPRMGRDEVAHPLNRIPQPEQTLAGWRDVAAAW